MGPPDRPSSKGRQSGKKKKKPHHRKKKGSKTKPSDNTTPTPTPTPTPTTTTTATTTHTDDLFSNSSKAILSREEKTAPLPAQWGFLVMCGSYVIERIPALNNYCVICDEPHVFATGNMLKPAVCSRELCAFSFQQMGVAGQCADEIATGAEVVDLLVCFATVAAKNSRADVIFDPYPQVFHPDNPKELLFDPNNKDIPQVNKLLSTFPSVQQMTQAKDFSDMKTQMDHAHPHAFPLLSWIISSNRSHIIKMDPKKHISKMSTKHQYVLLSAPPEREMRFR